MKKIFLLFCFISSFNCFKNKLKNNIINNSYLNGFYMINNIFSNSNFKYNNKSLELSNKYDLFNIIHIHKNLYYIKTRELKTIGIDDKNNIIILEENINKQKIIWNIINIGEDNYIIQNNYNKKFISVTNNKIITSNFNISFILNKVKINKIIYEKYIFKLIKFFEKYTLKNEHIKYILTN